MDKYELHRGAQLIAKEILDLVATRDSSSQPLLKASWRCLKKPHKFYNGTYKKCGFRNLPETSTNSSIENLPKTSEISEILDLGGTRDS